MAVYRDSHIYSSVAHEHFLQLSAHTLYSRVFLPLQNALAIVLSTAKFPATNNSDLRRYFHRNSYCVGYCPSDCGSASIFGTHRYSDDSSICTAAIHAGVFLMLGDGYYAPSFCINTAKVLIDNNKKIMQKCKIKKKYFLIVRTLVLEHLGVKHLHSSVLFFPVHHDQV